MVNLPPIPLIYASNSQNYMAVDRQADKSPNLYVFSQTGIVGRLGARPLAPQAIPGIAGQMACGPLLMFLVQFLLISCPAAILFYPYGAVRMKLAAYDTGQFYDELVRPDGQARSGAAPLMERVTSLHGRRQFGGTGQQAAERDLLNLGLAFTVYERRSGHRAHLSV